MIERMFYIGEIDFLLCFCVFRKGLLLENFDLTLFLHF